MYMNVCMYVLSRTALRRRYQTRKNKTVESLYTSCSKYVSKQTGPIYGRPM